MPAIKQDKTELILMVQAFTAETEEQTAENEELIRRNRPAPSVGCRQLKTAQLGVREVRPKHSDCQEIAMFLGVSACL
jgi:hypothetical protein